MQILLVEDNPDVVLMLETFFEIEGWSCTSALNVEEGLARFESLGADVVVTDYVLPHQNGMEVARKVRATSDCPIVMFTAFWDPDLVEAAAELGVKLVEKRDPSKLIEELKLEQARLRNGKVLDS